MKNWHIFDQLKQKTISVVTSDGALGQLLQNLNRRNVRNGSG
jgi:hypothetical protein